MLRRSYLIVGLFLILIGMVLFVNSFQNINGFVIVDNIEAIDSGFAGVSFIFAGIFSLLLSKKRKVKGQAAVEFLMTYGWAILASVIVLGTLAFFGIFNSSSFSPSAAVLSPPFNLNAWSVTTTEIALEIGSAGYETYQITEILISYTGGSCSEEFNEVITPENKKKFTIPCSLEEGKTFNADIIVKYRKSASNLEQTAYGTISGKVVSGSAGGGSPSTYVLSVVIEPENSGTVTCDGAPCLEAYNVDEEVTISAEAEPEYEFTGWTGDACLGEPEICTFVMSSDITLIVNFNFVG